MTTAEKTKEMEAMTTTASFVITVAQLHWVRTVAKRRAVSVSEIVREVMDQAITKPIKNEEAA